MHSQHVERWMDHALFSGRGTTMTSIRRRGNLVEDEARPLTDAEISAFKRQINSRLLKRFLATIDRLQAELADREERISRSTRGAKGARVTGRR